jgi:hypothetical protein
MQKKSEKVQIWIITRAEREEMEGKMQIRENMGICHKGEKSL